MDFFFFFFHKDSCMKDNFRVFIVRFHIADNLPKITVSLHYSVLNLLHIFPLII